MLTGIDSNSALMRTAASSVAAVKRVPLVWWQGLVILLLLLVLANSTARLLWALWPQQKQEQVVKATLLLQQEVNTAVTGGVDVNKLLQLNVYGVAGEVPVDQPIDIVLTEQDIEAEDTRLALTLTGVLSSNDTQSARAMIAHNNKQAIYSVGDKLPAGRNVTLDRVLERRVILNNAGRYESLWLFEEMEKTELLVETPPSASVVPDTGRSAASQRTAARAVTQALPTPETLAQVVRVTPHKKGFSVKPLKNLAQFEQLGLKTGDVVTAVNGTAVSANPEELRQLYLEVLQSPTAQMQVLRNGQTVNIDVDLGKLSQAISQ
ncbi:MAG: type II secretion system protein GspC [Porticoccaceae bacterium]|nr:type II secretion system protein GspC [Porticoccaceae bacterium]